MTKKQKIIVNGQDLKINNNYYLLPFIMIQLHWICYSTKYDRYLYQF